MIRLITRDNFAEFDLRIEMAYRRRNAFATRRRAFAAQDDVEVEPSCGVCANAAREREEKRVWLERLESDVAALERQREARNARPNAMRAVKSRRRDVATKTRKLRDAR